jgi:enolase
MNGGRIRSLKGRQVWDSRGRPTIEVEVVLESGATGRAIAPSGASTGKREALDLRDGGARLGGFGVNTALASVNQIIASRLAGMDASNQAAIDRALIDLDGTPQKRILGGNACVAVSSAVAWGAASHARLPLWAYLRRLAALPETPHIPAPMIQIFGGGAHAGNRVDLQDFLVIPVKAKTFAEAIEWTAEIYMAAASLMKKEKSVQGVCDEGGLWPDFARNEEALIYLTRAIELAGFKKGGEVAIAIDVAASEFSKEHAYALALDKQRLFTNGLIDLLARWCDAYPIVSLEDPLAEDDDAGFVEITRRLGGKVQIIGDDYLTTNVGRIRSAANLKACNSVLLKSNQCGTITELIEASTAAKKLGWNTIMSGRSGESEDVTLSHLAVGLMSDQIKVGSVTRSERTAKWNEMIRIEEGTAAGAYWQFRLPFST